MSALNERTMLPLTAPGLTLAQLFEFRRDKELLPNNLTMFGKWLRIANVDLRTFQGTIFVPTNKAICNLVRPLLSEEEVQENSTSSQSTVNPPAPVITDEQIVKITRYSTVPKTVISFDEPLSAYEDNGQHNTLADIPIFVAYEHGEPVVYDVRQKMSRVVEMIQPATAGVTVYVVDSVLVPTDGFMGTRGQSVRAQPPVFRA